MESLENHTPTSATTNVPTDASTATPTVTTSTFKNPIPSRAVAIRRILCLRRLVSLNYKLTHSLEREVDFLDSRIAILIQNVIQPSNDGANRLSMPTSLVPIFDGIPLSLSAAVNRCGSLIMPSSRLELYGTLFFHLQNYNLHLVAICDSISVREFNTLVQIVMFSLYGNHYDTREEYLLLSLLRGLIARQFDAANDYGGLLRANTPVTRLLTTYNMRGPGRAYLKRLLSSRIQAVAELNDLDMEISPIKVYTNLLEKRLKLVSMASAASERLAAAIAAATTNPGPTSLESIKELEIAALAAEQAIPPELPSCLNNTDASDLACVQEVLQARILYYKHLGNIVVNDIIKSASMVPYGIRWICKTILCLTCSRFPEAPHSLALSIVGSYFLLRYINPAIVTPQSYQLLQEPLKPGPRCTLTMLAKMIQMLGTATPGTTTAQSISMLIPLQKWAQEKVSNMNKFLVELCDVEDFNCFPHADAFSSSSARFYAQKLSTVANAASTLSTSDEEIKPQNNRKIPSLLSELNSNASLANTSCSTIASHSTASIYIQSLLETQSLNSIPSIIAENKFNVPPDATPDTHRTNMRIGTSPNELFSAHAILEENREFLAPEIRALIDLLGPPPPLLPRAANHQFSLKLVSPRKISTTTTNHLSLIEEMDAPPKSATKPENLTDSHQSDSDSDDFLMEENAVGGIEISEALEKAQQIALICQCDSAESRQELFRELSNLETAYRGIHARQAYLQTQLSSYKTYFNNIRKQSPNQDLTVAKAISSNRASQSSTYQEPAAPIVPGNKSRMLTYRQMKKENLVVTTQIPRNRQSKFYLRILCTGPESFSITAEYTYKGCCTVETEIQLQELKEKYGIAHSIIDMKYVGLRVKSLVQILDKLNEEAKNHYLVQ